MSLSKHQYYKHKQHPTTHSKRNLKTAAIDLHLVDSNEADNRLASFSDELNNDTSESAPDLISSHQRYWTYGINL